MSKEGRSLFFRRSSVTVLLGAMIISTGIANGRRSFFLPDISPFLGDLATRGNKILVITTGLDGINLWNKKIAPVLLPPESNEEGQPIEGLPIYEYCQPPEDATAIDFSEILTGKDARQQVDAISRLVKDKGVHCEYGSNKRKLFQGYRSGNESGIYEAIPLPTDKNKYTLVPFVP